MRREFRLAATLTVVLVLLAASWGCEEEVGPRNPLLPTGFADTLVPQAPLSAYLYANQGKAITFATSHFQDVGVPEGGELPPLPEVVGLDTLRLWANPSVDSFGALFDFVSEQEAQAIAQVLQSRQEDAQGVWHHQEAGRLFLVKGSDPWADSLTRAIEENQMGTLQDEYPEVWKTVQMLPENPPSRPVAAGFVKVNQELIESLATKAGMETRGVGSATGFIRITDIAFAVYSGRPLEVGEAVDQDYFVRAQASGIFVARSDYPGFLLSLILNILEGRSPLEKVSLGEDASAFYLSLDPMHAMIGHRGNLVFGSLAPSREGAQELLASALGVGG